MTFSDRPKVLRNLRLSEVSWVDRPANPGAELMVFKRDVGFESEPSPGLSEIDGSDADDDQSLLSPSGLFHDLAAQASGASEDKSVADTTLEAQLAELKARLEQAEADKAAAESKVTETEKRVSAVEKAENERFTKLAADLEKAAKDAAEAQEIAKAERAAREFVELTKRADNEFPFAGKAEAVARELRRIAKIEDPDERAEAEDALKTRNAARKLVVQSELGKAGRPAIGDGSAQAEIIAEAEKLAKVEGLSLGEATRKLAKTRPDLWDSYYAERTEGRA